MIGHGFSPENNNFIEKMVSKRAIKSRVCNGFSPFFVTPLFFNKHKREAAAGGGSGRRQREAAAGELNLACGRRYD